MAPWHVGELPAAPAPGWRLWIGLLGPGVVLAGTSIGSGEWLFGPAVSAQYGGTLLWLASLSILLQVFCNLMMMRYTVYCGEPIIVGGLRTAPGPKFWIPIYLILDLASIWPYNASNAAVPLAAAILGHLPGEGTLRSGRPRVHRDRNWFARWGSRSSCWRSCRSSSAAPSIACSRRS